MMGLRAIGVAHKDDSATKTHSLRVNEREVLANNGSGTIAIFQNDGQT
jgi:hypothetical protein